MNRYQNMEEFLKFFASVYNENPDLEIDKNTIYSNLAIYGLTQEDINDRYIGDNFENWIDNFQNDPNLSVYYTQIQPGFLQFQNKKSLGDKHVKLYLSYPKDKINHCVNKIFEYISKEDMPTCSKVSRSIRSDSVVLRMDNFNDAAKVINYINRDYELSNYTKETNPFSIKHGAVGIAYDDMLSYNMTLSYVMEEYFNYCRSNNILSLVSVEHFRQYANEYRDNYFKSEDGIYEFSQKDIVVEYQKRFNSIGDELLNYEQVLELICTSLNADANIYDYDNFYRIVKDKRFSDKKVDYYNNVINSKVMQQRKVDEIQIINSYIELAINKYGSDNVHLYLEDYIRGNVNAITRENDFRDLFKQYIPSSKLISLTGNINDYVNNYIQTKQQNMQMDNYNMFLYASIETYKKYGYRQLYCAIVEGIKGNYTYFTNGNYQYRKYLSENILPKDILNYCSIAIQMNNNSEPSNDVINEFCGMISGYAMGENESQYNSSGSTK